MEKDLLSIKNLNKEDIFSLIDRAIELKKQARKVNKVLTGYSLGLIFEKSSTRTRVSFETAMFRLGGQTIFLSSSDMQIARGETVADTAKVLSRYLDGVVIRTYSQDLVEEMAQYSAIPIINGLTDLYHPCQILSDLMTIKEKIGSLEDMKVAWIGDGNNMANSWINAANILGFELVLACPEGYQPDSGIMKGANHNIKVVLDPKEAAYGADAINTDVWYSMGHEGQEVDRKDAFQSYQVNQDVVDAALKDVLIMHCLPAHRDEEISAGVIDGPNSIVFDQAENKMHLHMSVLEKLLLDR